MAEADVGPPRNQRADSTRGLDDVTSAPSTSWHVNVEWPAEELASASLPASSTSPAQEHGAFVRGRCHRRALRCGRAAHEKQLTSLPAVERAPRAVKRLLPHGAGNPIRSTWSAPAPRPARLVAGARRGRTPRGSWCSIARSTGSVPQCVRAGLGERDRMPRRRGRRGRARMWTTRIHRASEVSDRPSIGGVWELAPFEHERSAWVRHVLQPPLRTLMPIFWTPIRVVLAVAPAITDFTSSLAAGRSPTAASEAVPIGDRSGTSSRRRVSACGLRGRGQRGLKISRPSASVGSR